MSDPGSENVRPSTTFEDSSAWRNSNAALATILSSPTYADLMPETRLLLTKVNEQFLQNLDFREDVLQLLALGPYRRASRTFPLMDLPVELRIMIADYALSYDDGLLWSWTVRPDGTRVGRFSDGYCSLETSGPSYILDALCLSRQLRRETANIMLKVNDIHFRTSMDIDFEEDGAVSKAVNNTVDDLDFFLSHVETSIIPSLAVNLNILMVGHRDIPVLQRLHKLIQDKDGLKLKVFDLGWGVTKHTQSCAQRFIQCGLRLQAKMDDPRLVDLGRMWRVFPFNTTDKDLSALRAHLSEDHYQLALEWINIGV